MDQIRAVDPNLMWNGRFASLSGDAFDNSAGFQFPLPEGVTAFPPNIYYIDTEGGQSHSLCRPGRRIAAGRHRQCRRPRSRPHRRTAQDGRRQQIHHMWTTHYHGDHVGSPAALAKQVLIMHFYDHGKPHPNDRIVLSRGGEPFWAPK